MQPELPALARLGMAAWLVAQDRQHALGPAERHVAEPAAEPAVAEPAVAGLAAAAGRGGVHEDS